MGRQMLVVVSDDQLQAERARSFGESLGLSVKHYSTTEWTRGMQDPHFRSQLTGDVASLAAGLKPLEEGAKILQFPGTGGHATATSEDGKKVRTINELESIAIENAIHEYHGNLTEAAKALGIGRATLYRKVKQYNIDPSSARRRKIAA